MKMSADNMQEIFDFISDNVSGRSVLEQLAEEASELAQASLKMIRTMEGSDNPTNITFCEAMKKLQEEYTDVTLLCDVLGLDRSKNLYIKKLLRWEWRIMENEKSQKQK